MLFQNRHVDAAPEHEGALFALTVFFLTDPNLRSKEFQAKKQKKLSGEILGI